MKQQIQEPIAKQSEQPFMPPVTCKPWCEEGDGHPRNHLREDQWCSTTQLTIDLHHIQSEADHEGAFSNNYLATHVLQPPAADPYVHLGQGENAGWELTIDESVSLALALLDQAERVRRNVDAYAPLVGGPVGERESGVRATTA